MATEQKEANKIMDLLEGHQTVMFVTHDKQGGLVSRPMTTQQPDNDGVVWFFVSSDADVIDEVKAIAEVNITYSKDKHYISLSGDASMVDDVEKKKELWYPELKKWFDGKGPEAEIVKLIKVQMQTARHWDTSSGQKGFGETNIIEY